MNVSAIIVTRGDIDLGAIVGSLPQEWERLFWSNGEGRCYVLPAGADPSRDETWTHWREIADLGVYGRYAAIEHASGDLIYVQDDDCVVSDPGALVRSYEAHLSDSLVVCNMPARFREQPQYASGEHALVGFGAVFHRDAPQRAFQQAGWWPGSLSGEMGFFYRTCDVVFTALTPRVLVDVPYENLPWADGPDRMYRQPEHVGERQRMLDLVRQVRDTEAAQALVASFSSPQIAQTGGLCEPGL